MADESEAAPQAASSVVRALKTLSGFDELHWRLPLGAQLFPCGSCALVLRSVKEHRVHRRSCIEARCGIQLSQDELESIIDKHRIAAEAAKVAAEAAEKEKRAAFEAERERRRAARSTAPVNARASAAMKPRRGGRRRGFRSAAALAKDVARKGDMEEAGSEFQHGAEHEREREREHEPAPAPVSSLAQECIGDGEDEREGEFKPKVGATASSGDGKRSMHARTPYRHGSNDVESGEVFDTDDAVLPLPQSRVESTSRSGIVRRRAALQAYLALENLSDEGEEIPVDTERKCRRVHMCKGCRAEFNARASLSEHETECAFYHQRQREEALAETGAEVVPRRSRKDDSSSDEDLSQDDFAPYMSTKEWKAFYARLMAEAKVSSGVLRNYKAASCFVYGEAMPNLVHAILRCLKLTPDDVFYDIGSGIGNVVLQVAAQTGARCLGIEIREDLDHFAQDMARQYEQRMVASGRAHGQVQLIQGDALNGDWDHLLVQPTVVFMNNVCYNGYMQARLLDKYMSMLTHGTRVVAIKNLFPRIDMTQNPNRWAGHPASYFRYPWYKGVVSCKHAVSWTSSSIAFYIYTVDRLQRNSAGIMVEGATPPSSYFVCPPSSGNPLNDTTSSQCVVIFNTGDTYVRSEVEADDANSSLSLNGSVSFEHGVKASARKGLSKKSKRRGRPPKDRLEFAPPPEFAEKVAKKERRLNKARGVYEKRHSQELFASSQVLPLGLPSALTISDPPASPIRKTAILERQTVSTPPSLESAHFSAGHQQDIDAIYGALDISGSVQAESSPECVVERTVEPMEPAADGNEPEVKVQVEYYVAKTELARTHENEDHDQSAPLRKRYICPPAPTLPAELTDPDIALRPFVDKVHAQLPLGTPAISEECAVEWAQFCAADPQHLEPPALRSVELVYIGSHKLAQERVVAGLARFGPVLQVAGTTVMHGPETSVTTHVDLAHSAAVMRLLNESLRIDGTTCKVRLLPTGGPLCICLSEPHALREPPETVTLGTVRYRHLRHIESVEIFWQLAHLSAEAADFLAHTLAVETDDTAKALMRDCGARVFSDDLQRVAKHPFASRVLWALLLALPKTYAAVALETLKLPGLLALAAHPISASIVRALLFKQNFSDLLRGHFAELAAIPAALPLLADMHAKNTSVAEELALRPDVALTSLTGIIILQAYVNTATSAQLKALLAGLVSHLDCFVAQPAVQLLKAIVQPLSAESLKPLHTALCGRWHQLGQHHELSLVLCDVVYKSRADTAALDQLVESLLDVPSRLAILTVRSPSLCALLGTVCDTLLAAKVSPSPPRRAALFVAFTRMLPHLLGSTPMCRNLCASLTALHAQFPVDADDAELSAWKRESVRDSSAFGDPFNPREAPFSDATQAPLQSITHFLEVDAQQLPLSSTHNVRSVAANGAEHVLVEEMKDGLSGRILVARERPQRGEVRASKASTRTPSSDEGQRPRQNHHAQQLQHSEPECVQREADMLPQPREMHNDDLLQRCSQTSRSLSPHIRGRSLSPDRNGSPAGSRRVRARAPPPSQITGPTLWPRSPSMSPHSPLWSRSPASHSPERRKRTRSPDSVSLSPSPKRHRSSSEHRARSRSLDASSQCHISKRSRSQCRSLSPSAKRARYDELLEQYAADPASVNRATAEAHEGFLHMRPTTAETTISVLLAPKAQVEPHLPVNLMRPPATPTESVSPSEPHSRSPPSVARALSKPVRTILEPVRTILEPGRCIVPDEDDDDPDDLIIAVPTARLPLRQATS